MDVVYVSSLIRRAITNFNWDKTFSNTNINEKVSLYNKTIFNVLNYYIPYETAICDDEDPSWFNSWIKSLIENKNKLLLKIIEDVDTRADASRNK